MPRTSSFVEPSTRLFNRAPEDGGSPSPTRRRFLSLGSMMTGGLLLPWAGGKALALANPGDAGNVPVVSADFPVSRELKAYRDAREALISNPFPLVLSQSALEALDDQTANTITLAVRHADKGHAEYRALYRAMVAAAIAVWETPVLNWGDVAARAEIAWEAAPKIEDPYGTNDMPIKGDGIDWPLGGGANYSNYPSALSVRASAELVEAVMTLTGGEKVDVRAERWRRHVWNNPRRSA